VLHGPTAVDVGGAGVFGGMAEDVVRDDTRRLLVELVVWLRGIKVEELLDKGYGAIDAVVGEAGKVAVVPKHGLEAKLHELGMEEIVSVEEEKKLASGVLQPDVACFRLSAIGLMNDLEAAVALSVFLGDASAAVRAAVVHEDGLPVLAGLTENAVECSAQECLDIVYGDDDGNHELIYDFTI